MTSGGFQDVIGGARDVMGRPKMSREAVRGAVDFARPEQRTGAALQRYDAGALGGVFDGEA